MSMSQEIKESPVQQIINTELDYVQKFYKINDFSINSDQFKDFLLQHQYDQFGADYKTISIIGPQNSGKNSFQALYSIECFRHNLRKWMWLKEFSKPLKEFGLVVLKKIEYLYWIFKDQIALREVMKGRWVFVASLSILQLQTFEQTTALLALSFSDLLFVNMWESDIGRAQGSSYEILKTIFEINLKLFKQDSAKNIIFIVRDFDMHRYGEKGFQNIKKRVEGRLEQMWNSIGKPEEFQNRPFEEFFGFSFETLPSIYKEQQFHQEVLKLRDRLVNRQNPKYLMNIKGTSDNVPVDGLPLFIESSWQKIRSDKDINLVRFSILNYSQPSQKQMISNLRCNQFKVESISMQKEAIEELLKTSKRKFNPNFKVSAQIIVQNALGKREDNFYYSLGHYRKSAKHYSKKIYTQVYQALQLQIFANLQKAYQNQLTVLDKQAYTQWKKNLAQFIRKDTVSEHFSAHMANIIKNIVSNFAAKAERLIVEGSDWNLDESIQILNEKLQSYAMSIQQQEVEKLKDIVTSKINLSIKRKTHNLMVGLDENFWDNLKSEYDKTLEDIIENIRQILREGFQLKSEVCQDKVLQVRKQGSNIIKTRVLKESKDLNNFLIDRFNILFKRDQNGNLRDWLAITEEQINKLFQSARETILSSLYKFNTFCIQSQFGQSRQNRGSKLSRGFTSNLEQTVLDQKQIQRIQKKFEEDIEIVYDVALNKHVNLSQSPFNFLDQHGRDGGRIHWMFWLISIFFGYEKILGYMYSPILFYPIILFAGVLAIMHSMGLSSVLISAVKLTINRLFRKFKIPLHI